MPSTIESSAEFEVMADLGSCWSFFRDLKNIGGCIPGCESVTPLDEKSAAMRVKFSIGYVSKTFELRVRFKEMVPESQVTFVGEGSDAEAVGTVSFRVGARPGSSILGYRIQIRPRSTLGRTAVAMMGNDLVKGQADEFASCVRTKIERATG